MHIYKKPLYYEIAFSFVNPKKQADLFEHFIHKFSKRKVKSVLDIGCGPALQLYELARRGYNTLGLDLSTEMLRHVQQKAKKQKLVIKTVHANMVNFRFKKKVDFAFIMMGTIGNLKDKKEIIKHLNAVAKSLNSGGLYLVENLTPDLPKKIFLPQAWTMRRGKIRVKVFYQRIKKGKKKVEEDFRMMVNDNGREFSLKESFVNDLLCAKEFENIVKGHKQFEFIGWFQRNVVARAKKPGINNIALLRRR